ncbi:MAG: GNAT family N-acetyltransferase [Candidatus Dormibacteraceae bacterium]
MGSRSSPTSRPSGSAPPGPTARRRRHHRARSSAPGGRRAGSRGPRDRASSAGATPAHAGGLNSAVVDSRPQLLPWMPWAREPTMKSSLELTRGDVREWAANHIFHFAMVDRETGMVLGVAGLNRESVDAAELHYWIRSDHAGRGLTTEAGRALIGWAQHELVLDHLTLWAGRDNHASRRVAEKLGFEHLGPLGWRPEGGEGDFDAESYELRFDRQAGGDSRA